MSRFLAWCVMFLGSCQFALYAQTISGKCGKNGSTVRWELDQSKGLLLLEGKGEMQDFAPDDERWKGMKDRISTVAVGEGITSIGDNAFAECQSLTNVQMGSSVETIGDSAFCNCGKLEDFKVAAGVREIGETAFMRCLKLKDITVDSANEHFKVGACGELIDKSCARLITFPVVASFAHPVYDVPADVTEIGRAAFYCCYKMRIVGIHKNVKHIGAGAFIQCNALTDIAVSVSNPYYSEEDGILYDKEKTRLISCPSAFIGKTVAVPPTVTEIGDYAFVKCRNLTAVNLPSSVKKIGYGAFYGCGKLKTVSLSEGLECIEGFAFTACKELSSQTLPASLESIGESAFMDCISLKSVCMSGEKLEQIGKYAFVRCRALKNLTFAPSVRSIGDRAFLDCQALREVDLPRQLTSMGGMAFAYCRDLNRVKLPGGLTRYNISWFDQSLDLRRIEVDEENPMFSVSDGMLFDKKKTKLLFCGGTRGQVRIPETVETIAGSAFMSLAASQIYFPATVKKFDMNSLPTISMAKERLHLYLPCPEVPELDGCQTYAKLTVAETRIYKGYGATAEKSIGPVLHVPKGCKQKYLDHPVWGKLFGGDKGEIKDDIK